MGDLLDTLILLGVLQGAGLSVLLAKRRDDALAHRLLALLTGAVALMLLLGYCEQRWAFKGHPHLLAIAAPLPFLFGPLLYLYIVALTRPVARVDARWLVHALPFLIDLIYMTQQFYLLSGDEKVVVARAYAAGKSGLSVEVIDVFELLQAIGYLAASWLELRRYGRKMQGYFSDLTRLDLRWLRAMVLAHAATWSVVIASTLTRLSGMQMPQLLDASGVQVGSTLVIFLTGYMSLWQPELFDKAGAAAQLEQPETIEPPATLTALAADAPNWAATPAVPPTTTTATTATDAARTKYQRNRIDDAEAEELVQRLLALMQTQQPYRDGALTLPVLAETLGVTPHALSQLLNVRIEKTFYAFINSYRVSALQEALADPRQNARGVLELALEAGFNSKSTLNAFFKRQTGVTPTEYRADAQRRAQTASAA